MCDNLDLAKMPNFVRRCFLLILLFSSLAIAATGKQTHAQAPIIPSGLNTQVSQPVTLPSGQTQYNITGGSRPGGGGNLFHSFGDFNVPNNNIANFLNESGLATSNILGRVTGGNISNIFGVIQTSNFLGANLFLMNPAGFLFGPTATVNVGGMVSFTSADYLRLTDGARFNVIPNAAADTLLTTAPVAAYGFLGSNPGAITIQGSQLSVTPGQSLSLVAGNITVQAGMLDDGVTIQPALVSAHGGQINLASVASPGEVILSNLQSAPNINGQSLTMMGNINLSQGALLDVSSEAAGTVRIRTGQLVMDQAAIVADTVTGDGAPLAIDINATGDVSISAVDVSALTARTTGSSNAGRIQLASNNVDLNVAAPNTFIVTAIDTSTSGSGTAGDVSITAVNNLTITGDPFTVNFAINSGTSGLDGGHGGNVTLTAKNLSTQAIMLLTGSFLADQFGTDTSGSGGNLTITADSVMMGSTLIATDGVGQAGNLTITARDVQITDSPGLGASISTASNSVGKGGSIQVIADQLLLDNTGFEVLAGTEGSGGITINGKAVEIRNGTAIRSATFTSGNAGDITITATDHLTLADDPSTGGAQTRPSGLFTNSFGNFGQGNAGAITVTTPTLEMTGGARIESSTRSSGGGGPVTLNADVISISGERPTEPFDGFFSQLGSSRASGIYTRTVGSEFCSGPCGDAGNVSVTTNSLNLADGGQINSGTISTGQGGNIVVNTTDPITLSGTSSDGIPSGILSQAAGTDPEAGSGGNISLASDQSVTVTNGATISTTTTGTGNAGNILVKANDISINGGGTITAASTGTGNAGTVTIQGPSSPANSFLVEGAGSGVFTNTEGTGAGGSISVEANAVTLQNGGTVSASTTGTSSSATGGNISISGGQFVQMNNGASITASSTGPGNAGNILVDAGPQLVMQNSFIKTEAAKAGGGNIEIRAVDLVQLGNSTVSTSVLGGSGSGGNITIDPNVVLLQNSQIIAQAVQGAGGNISITTNLLLPDSTSLISASSQFGQQGNIVIQSPVSPASGKLVPLGQKPLIATSLLSQRCAAIAGGSISSFTVAGRDSLPSEPGGWVSSPLALSMSESEEGTVREANGSMLDESPLLSLRKIAPSGFLTQAFATDSSGCHS